MKLVNVLSRDEKFFDLALTVARISDYSTKVGCVAAKGNKLICSASNRLRNPAINVSYREATYHAEFNVLNMLDAPGKVTLYIARISKFKFSMPSRPCSDCMKEIGHFEIKEIVYLNQFMHLVKEKL